MLKVRYTQQAEFEASLDNYIQFGNDSGDDYDEDSKDDCRINERIRTN